MHFTKGMFGKPWVLGAKKHIKKKTRKQNFHGIVPGFWGGFCSCVSVSPIRTDPTETHKQICATPPSPGTIPQICLCLCASSFPVSWESGVPLPLRKYYDNYPCVSKQCPADGVWRIGRAVSQTGFERHGLPPQRALLDTVYPLRDHLNSVQRMVSGGYCEGLFPDTVCWTQWRNTWIRPEYLRVISGVSYGKIM